jgi:hypothetical protein
MTRGASTPTTSTARHGNNGAATQSSLRSGNSSLSALSTPVRAVFPSRGTLSQSQGWDSDSERPFRLHRRLQGAGVGLSLGLGVACGRPGRMRWAVTTAPGGPGPRVDRSRGRNDRRGVLYRVQEMMNDALH